MEQAALINGCIVYVKIDNTPLFPFDFDATIKLYEQYKKVLDDAGFDGRKLLQSHLGSWNPERHDWSVKHDRDIPYYIQIHPNHLNDEIRHIIREAGLPLFVNISKTEWTLRDIYNRASEAEQIEMDRGWVAMGGFLSEEKEERLRKADGR